MSTYNVHVSGISPATSETHLHDFFTFCGKINSIDYKESTAVIYFDKASAAKTALMLNGGTLDGSQLTVTSDSVHADSEESGDRTAPIDQTDKPRAGIAAEYLARGYTLSDHILQRAIELDNERGISKRFLNYIHGLDNSLGARALGPDQTISSKVQSSIAAATSQAKTVDEQRGISKSVGDYYSKALSLPFGQKVLSFYTTTSKQVRDIHEEARRIADQQKAPDATSAAGSNPAAASSEKQPDPTTQAAPTVL